MCNCLWWLSNPCIQSGRWLLAADLQTVYLRNDNSVFPKELTMIPLSLYLQVRDFIFTKVAQFTCCYPTHLQTVSMEFNQNNMDIVSTVKSITLFILSFFAPHFLFSSFFSQLLFDLANCNRCFIQIKFVV